MLRRAASAICFTSTCRTPPCCWRWPFSTRGASRSDVPQRRGQTKETRAGLKTLRVLCLRPSRQLIATSPPYAESSDLLRAYRSKVCVLPFGVNLRPFFNPGPEVLRRAEVMKNQHGRPLWLAVGRLVYYKGLHNAIRALASVPGRLLVVGDGPLEPDLRRLAEEVGVADRVSGVADSASKSWPPPTTPPRLYGSPATPVVRLSAWSRSRPWRAAAQSLTPPFLAAAFPG